MNKADLEFGLIMAGIGVGVITLTAAVVYLIVSVAKWAWSG